MGEEEGRSRLRIDGRGGDLHRDHDARAHRRRCKRALDSPCGSSKSAGGTNHGRCFTSRLNSRQDDVAMGDDERKVWSSVAFT